MKKDDLIQSILSEAEDIQIPELSERARKEPISTVPSEVNSVHRRKRINPFRTITIMLILTLGFGFFFTNIMRAETKVTIDINPSIELTLNGNDRVIAVRAYNDEGVKFIQNVDVMYKPLNLAVENVIGVACDLNYIKKNEQNAVLFSVKSIIPGKESYHEDGLRTAFSTAVAVHDRAGSFCYSEYTSDDEIKADKHHLSPAKLAFIRELLEQKYKRSYAPKDVPNTYFNKSVTQLIQELK